MPSIVSCVVFAHNVWLVAAAAGVCVLGSCCVLLLFDRAAEAAGRQRLGWQTMAAISAGASIWCTHFVAILAYEPGAPVGFDPFLTISSGLMATGGALAAFVVALSHRGRVASLIGGALLGGAIAAMHYCGMLAYRVEGFVSWREPYLAASLAAACGFGAASLYVAVYGSGRRRRPAAAALMVAAIVSLHFLGMAALKITPLLVAPAAQNGEAEATLAVAILAMTLVIIATGAVAYGLDETLRADASRRLRAVAAHDGLTGLPNRASFLERLESLTAQASREEVKVALVVADINGFKHVNDQFGHAAGDVVLKRVAERLAAALSGREAGGRLGGDEFAVAKPLRAAADIDDFLRRVAAAFVDPIAGAEFCGEVGVSIGVAIFPHDAADAESLVNNADLAMHRAKAEQSGHACYYERAMDERVRARRRLAAELRAAIANDELEAHYQPQADVADGALQGFEALARWPRNGGYTPPCDFIPIAEEFGLIDALGEWMLRRACAEAATWSPSYRVAVNLSPVQLARPGLAAKVAEVLAETGLPPQRLELELTESAIIGDAEASLRVMREIRELGVSLALDDFGTGHSSLSTLRNFPFDKIKLDRSFLWEIETSAEAKAVLKAVLALGQGLNIPVLTEGVETQGQLEMLRAAGCDQAQGYLLGRPCAMKALVAAGVLGLRPQVALNDAA